MKILSVVMTISPLLLLHSTGEAAVSTGQPFYGDPPDEHHPWAIHDRNRPQPKRVEPGTFSTPDQPGKPPSDAVVLFDGTAEMLAKWEADTAEGGPSKWIVKDSAMECVPKSGYIRTKELIGDCQLHVEWAAPANVRGDSQDRGNSGIFLMGLCEVQVLDNYNNPTYADGFAASVYGVNPPLANALRPPGEFQVIDIVFRRPIYRGEKMVDPGYITVFCNGVLMQDQTPLEGPTGHMKRTAPRPFPEKGPLKLQDHGNPVRYRNIWYRSLPPRAVEGGTDGILTAEATAAKRKEIAAAIRSEAAKLETDSTAKMLRLAESLVYERDAAVQAQVEQMAERYAGSLKSLSPEETEKRKGEIRNATRALKYLAKIGVLSSSFGPTAALDRIEKAQGWDQPKK
jgi:hypothetical protein